VTWRGLYPGISLTLREVQGEAALEVQTAPGADLGAFRLRVAAATTLRTGPDGRLVAVTPIGPVILPAVLRDGHPLLARPAGRDVSFTEAQGPGSVPPPAAPTDPSIGKGFEYGTFLGGSDDDHYGGVDLALGPDGSTYVAGTTFSTNFPTTPGAFDTMGDENGDLFISRLDPSGSSLLYSTYLGGTAFDVEHFLTVGSDGAAYVSGTTASSDYPTTPGAFDPSFNGGDGFITKLDSTGSTLVYSTFLGGTSPDTVEALALAGDGSVFATGETASDDFPTTPGAFDSTLNGEDDAFVTELNPAGSDLVYSTYLGGSYNDFGYGIALGPDGTAYVTGFVQSSDFPTTPGAFDETFNGGNNDLFVTHVNSEGSALTYSTYVGGNDGDYGRAIAVDPAGNAFITGNTDSPDYPTTPGAYDRTINSSILADVFATKLNAAGGDLVYSTFLGGTTQIWVRISSSSPTAA